jgi:nucleotide-binding universal stress UspA family protein
MAWLQRKCVVVPFDYSEESTEAARLALQFVEDASHLHIVHVLGDLTPPDFDMVWAAVDNGERQKRALEGLRGQFAADEFAGIDITVRIGDPGQEITDFAAEISADLIVIPSHGRRGVKRLLLGSVAERVIRLAHCPVLVLRK